MPPLPPRLLLAATLAAVATVCATAEGKGGRSGPSTPLTIVRTQLPLYPEKLADRFLDKGEARILIMVDEQGRLVDWMVTGYTHALFAKEALDVIQKWKYESATFHGQPVPVRTELRFLFRNSGGVRIVPGDLEMRLRVREINDKEVFWQRTCQMEELDSPPDAIVEIQPMPPDRLGAIAREGKVVVEYYIDPDGRVRMPLIVSSDDEAFSQSVLLAISEWKYATPTREGQPVLVRVAREFNFRPINVAGSETVGMSGPDRTRGALSGWWPPRRTPPPRAAARRGSPARASRAERSARPPALLPPGGRGWRLPGLPLRLRPGAERRIPDPLPPRERNLGQAALPILGQQLRPSLRRRPPPPQRAALLPRVDQLRLRRPRRSSRHYDTLPDRSSRNYEAPGLTLTTFLPTWPMPSLACNDCRLSCCANSAWRRGVSWSMSARGIPTRKSPANSAAPSRP